MSGIGSPDGQIRNAILIAGPTASGKSRLALDLARRDGNVIVNADSMQVYSGLPILTAQPDAEDLSAAPHLLYGVLPPSVAYSTGAWVRDVMALHARGALSDRPIFVGGTGLYFRALTTGLSQMPDVPDDVRAYWRKAHDEIGAVALHAQLESIDPLAACRLQPTDGQRIIRALEVMEASGQSIFTWQEKPGIGAIELSSATMLVLEPDREWLRERIDRRFDQMVDKGAVEEVRNFRALDLDPTLPAMRAIGVPELIRYLDGQTDLATAMDAAKAASRQYAKRQLTWFRGQLSDDWKRLPGRDFSTESVPI